MITPSEIKKKALRQYSAFLTAVLNRQKFFPLHIKGNKGKANQPIEDLFHQLKPLIENAKEKTGFGYTITLKKVNTRHAGIISMPDEIFFQNVEDYLKFLEKEAEFLKFRKTLQLTLKQIPELQNWMAANPLKVIKQLDNWENILKVGTYFLKNPQPNLYARELPIDVPAVFIENNTATLTEVLEAILPKNLVRKRAKSFEQKFGLKYDEPIIRMRNLSNDFENFPKGINDLTLSLNFWNENQPTAKTIYLISDKMNFLRLPKKENAVAIFASKVFFEHYLQLKFLKEKEVYFWGDLSLESFQKLSNLRKTFPKIQSFLMDNKTMEKYSDFVEEVKTLEVSVISHLTNEETEVLNWCLGGKRILQKHILQKDIIKILKDES